MKLRKLFETHGLRCTKQRMMLYEILRECKSHPTAEELYRLIEQRSGHMSRATVYNTLNALHLSGLCRKLPTTDGSSRYDADISEHLHVRFRDSDEIMDLPDELGRKLLQAVDPVALREIEQELGISIDGVNLQLLARRRGQG